MSARYIVRFDDICPTMNWAIWTEVEAALIRSGTRPIVAVVPDNQDRSLEISEPRRDFWSIVRGWQARGWTIGCHGYRHEYESATGGMIGVHPRSEFAGLPREVQRRKLGAAVALFQQNGVKPDIWVAPGHSFDLTTVRLLPEFGIRAISDGLSWRVVTDSGCTWIPQQLWRFRRLAFGVWTVCLHVNHWKPADVSDFRANLERFSGSIIPVESVLKAPAPARSAMDASFSSLYRHVIRLRQRIKRAATS